MAHITADRVRQLSTSTGTGPFTVSTTFTGFRAFSSVLAVGDTFWYTIAHTSLSEWEVGLGTYSAANTITRTTVLSSSTGSAVLFSAGDKDVFITAAAGKFLQQNAAGSYGNFTAGTITAALTGNASTATTAGTVTTAAQTAITSVGTLTALSTSGAVLLNGAAQIGGSSSAVCIQYTGGGTQYGITMRPGTDSTTVLNIMNAAGTSVGSISQTATTATFNGALNGAASSNVLKAGDTMTGVLNISTGGGVASSSKHINLVNGTGYELFLIPRAAGGAYNGLTAAGDSLIAFTTGTQDTGALVIGPWSATAKGIRIDSSGNVGIGATSTTYKLQVVGSFAATTKSFVIPHPTKEGKQLRYGSLEGPENGVYVRGRLKDNDTIELPEYWTGLVDEDSITINLTPIGKHQKLYVESIKNNIVIIGNENLLNKSIDCFYIVFAERKDVEKLKVEI